MRLLPLAVLLGLLGVGACSKEAPPAPVSSAPAPPSELKTPITGPIPAEYEEPMVGGALMSAGKDMMSNLARSADHTRLVAALQATGLSETLQGAGPFTLFAPTNAAFDQLPPGTLDSLMQPANREELLRILGYHVVEGRLDAEALQSLILAGNGSAMLKTVEGTGLKATVGNGKAMVVDANGGLAAVSTANVVQTNGVMHVVDKVLMP